MISARLLLSEELNEKKLVVTRGKSVNRLSHDKSTHDLEGSVFL